MNSRVYTPSTAPRLPAQRSDAAGRTTISGPVADQAALHGLLTRIRDLGLTLLEVSCTDQ